MATPFSSRFRHFFQKMTDDKHMNPDDQPLDEPDGAGDEAEDEGEDDTVGAGAERAADGSA